MAKRGLGKGLGALIPSVPEGEELKDVQSVEVGKIQPNKYQPRRNIDDNKLGELSESIKEHGVVQPIVLRKIKENSYEIVAGERRWRAAKLAGLDEIPAVVREYDNQQVSEIALIENIQREDLNSVEEAWAYKMLIESFRLTQETLSKRVGKSRSHIANSLRLLNLPPDIITMLSDGRITSGHARAILSLENEESQKELADKIIKEKLSVRETEKTAAEILQRGSKKKKEAKKSRVATSVSPIFLVIEEELQEFFGTKVAIKDRGGKGKIEIGYYSEEDLQRIIDTIKEKE